MSVIKIDQNNFESVVMNSAKPVLVDFWAPWCAPCRMFSSVIDEIAEENAHIAVGKVNVDENPALAQQFQIMGIPAAVLFENGRPVRRLVGLQPKDAVEEMIG